MPVRIVVRLHPAHPRALPPPHTGPAVHAAFLSALAGVDPGLATALHDDRKHKPFTLTPLLDGGDNRPRTPGIPVRFEVGLLLDVHTAAVLTALYQRGTFRVGTTTYGNAGVEITAAESFDELAQRADTRTTWTFRLCTPVGFATARDQGPRRDRPWPDATPVFTALATRWDRFAAPVTLPPEVWTTIQEHVETSGGDIRIVEHLTEPTQRHHPSGYRHGAIGTVTYRLVQAHTLPPAALRAMDALARFATYAGIGDRTAIGMGHVRLQPPQPNANTHNDPAPNPTTDPTPPIP